MKNLMSKFAQSIRAILVLGLTSTFFVIGCTEDKPDEGLFIPYLAHDEAQEITRTSALLKGNIEIYQGNMVKECGFLYSTSSNFPEDATKQVKVELSQHGGDGVTQSLQKEITDLKPNTHYYFSLYAMAGPSMIMSKPAGEFTTLSTTSPKFSMLRVDSIGENVLKVSCDVVEIGDEYLLECGVQYKNDMMDAYIPVPAVKKASGDDRSYTVYLKDLQPSTMYTIRPYAKNSASNDGSNGVLEGYGTPIHEETQKLLSAKVITGEVNAGMTSITMSGWVENADGSKGVLDECGFCYSKTNKNPTIVDETVKVAPTELKQVFKGTLTDLSVNTLYYVRAYAKNTVDGRARFGYGEVKQITTTELKEPDLMIYDSTSGLDTITVKGRIMNYEEQFLTQRGFLWSAEKSTLNLDDLDGVQNVQISGKGDSFETTIKKLNPNRPYYVCAYAIYNTKGVQKVGYSGVETIRTEVESKAKLKLEVVPLDFKSVKLQGVFESSGNVPLIERGFCWMKGKGNLTILTGNKQVTDKNFEYVLDEMEYGETYSARAYAVCVLDGKEEVVYSDTKVFTSETIPLPVVHDFVPVEQHTFSTKFKFSLSNEADAEVLEVGSCLFWQNIPKKPKVDGADIVTPFVLSEEGKYVGTIEGMMPGYSYIYIYVRVRYKGIETIEFIRNASSGQKYYSCFSDLRISKFEANQKDGNSFIFKGTIRDFAYARDLTDVGLVWKDSKESTDWNEVTNRKSIKVNEKGEFEATIENLESLKSYHVGIYLQKEDKIAYSYDICYIQVKRAPDEGDNDTPNKREE